MLLLISMSYSLLQDFLTRIYGYHYFGIPHKNSIVKIYLNEMHSQCQIHQQILVKKVFSLLKIGKKFLVGMW